MFNVELRYGYRSMYFEFETLELAQDFIKVAMNAECMSDIKENGSELTAIVTFKKTYEKEEK